MNNYPYQFQGFEMSRDNDMFQDALLESYDAKHRPLCMCTPKGVPMYIARISPNELIIKRMPGTGALHHFDCDSYEIPSELSGRGALDDKAVHQDLESGLTSLKLDFSLSKRTAVSATPTASSNESNTATLNPKKLSILSLLHYLYDEAGLSKWSPKMAGKRNWYIIRKYLLEAATNKVSGKNQITDLLLIPEPFKLDQKDQIEARRKTFMASLKADSKQQRKGILIGELKSIESARFGYKLVIKHMPLTPFYLSEQLHKRIHKIFDVQLAQFAEIESSHLLVVATFMLSASGNPTVDTVAMMSVDRNWLPFENTHELELNERLSDRQFIKSLRYNLGKDEIVASALLTDTLEQTAIYIQANTEDEAHTQAISSIIEDSDLQSIVWSVDSGEPLQLPEKVDKNLRWTNQNPDKERLPVSD